MATLPRIRALRCLDDPTLYFSRLPQDIRRHCIRPLLSCFAVDLLCDEDWTEPSFIKTLTLPCLYDSSRSLKFENCLLIFDRSNYLQMIDFLTGQPRWSVKASSIRRINRPLGEDTLMVKGVSDMGYAKIERISQIRSGEEFFSLLLAQQSQHSLQWKQEYVQLKHAQRDRPLNLLPNTYLTKLSELMRECPLPPYERIIGGYYDCGYLILATDANRLHFYTCTTG